MMENYSGPLVCRCKAVKKDEIVEAIRKHNAVTVGAIQLKTAASTGCGRCIRHVEKILREELDNLQKNSFTD